jgi:transposase
MGGDESERLSWKQPLHSLEIELQRDYGLTPVSSRALVTRLGEFLDTWLSQAEGARSPGQVIYPAVALGERAGKPLRYCLTIPVSLTLLHPADAEVLYTKGSPALRQSRLSRMCDEAWQQGATLSHEDASLLLGVEVSTIRRMIRACTEDGGARPPTRGLVADIGPTVTHKEQVIRLFFRGFLPNQIASRTGHSLGSVERYLMDFGRVAELSRRGATEATTARVTGMSLGLVDKYRTLLGEYSRPENRPVLDRLLSRFGAFDLEKEEVDDG